MKKMFFGLLVAVTGFGASAFTDAASNHNSRFADFFVTSATTIGGAAAYNWSQGTPPNCPDGNADVCSFTSDSAPSRNPELKSTIQSLPNQTRSAF